MSDRRVVGGTGRRPSRPSLPGRLGRLPALLGALAALLPAAAGAHGPPVALDFWGRYPAAVARCQHAIGSASAACAQRAWRLRRACELERLAGRGCNDSAVRQAIVSARLAAQDRVRLACTSTQLQLLQFIDLSEAQRDVNRFCQQVEVAARSVVFRPAVPPATHAARACVAQVARTTSKLFAGGFRSYQRTFDHIARANLSPARKHALVAASRAAVRRLTTAGEAAVGRACPDPLFAELYHGRTPAQLLTALATRPDCLGGDAYAQAAVLCPPAVCGNRMIEADEECDDGNTAAGDGCDAGCFAE